MWKSIRRATSSVALMTLCLCLISAPRALALTDLPATDGSDAVEIRLHPGIVLRDPSPASSEAKRDALAPQAKSAVVMDFATGKVLYQKDAHEKLPMASITKIMTMLLTMEAIDGGRLRYTDKIRTSEYASSMGGSQIFLEAGETMTVNELLKGIAIASANDACVAIAEHLCGSESEFVEKMNDRAKQLGMDDTHFVNCNGLPAPNHYSSAHDIALMSRELLKHPEITRYTSVYSDYLRKDTDHPLWLVNTNKLVRFFDGVDGLKTGFTAEAKYCLSATAKRGDGFRIIAVVMGEPRSTIRNAEVSHLLNWTFSRYDSKVLYRQGDTVVSNVKVSHGVSTKLSALAGDTVGVIQERGEKEDYTTKAEVFRLTAPIKPGQRIGTLRVYNDDDVVSEVPLVASHAVRRAGLFETIGQTIRGVVTFGR